MSKYIILTIIALSYVFPITANSLESVNVAVLPFKIESETDLSYLSLQIPKLIRAHLEEDGARIIDPSSVPDFIDYTMEDDPVYIDKIKRFGITKGADYVIWGSLKRVDEEFTLNARMIESFTNKPAKLFFSGGDSIEELSGIIVKLADDISMKIFRKEKVARVRITGNQRIETDAIKRVISTAPGDIYLAKSLSKDLKAVYKMGYFEDIRIETEDGPDGKIVLFKIKEKATVKKIKIKGNLVYKDEEIKENLKLKTGSILNIYQIRSDMTRIEELYKSKHYHNVKIVYKIHSLKNNQADLEFIITEGKKVRIKTITFQGNSIYTSKQLKKIMKTKQKSLFSFVTSSGDLNRDNLDQDTARLSAFYQNSGYITARISDPVVEFKGDWIYITIKIDEGLRYKVGKVDIKGDLIVSKEQLIKPLQITKETYFNRHILQDDVLVLTDIYSNAGYAYADISPTIGKNKTKLEVDITYVISKGKLVYFEEIIIAGNTKTRDKVIRRELPLYEQGLYSGRLLKRGVRNLKRLEFFEDVKVDTHKGSSDDKMVLKVNVKEKPTGSFSFGGGYSNVENVFVIGSVSQKNLFGRGQILSVKAEVGSRTTSYILDFTEPWLYDIPLEAGCNLYNWNRDYDSYDTDTKGGGFHLSYPIYDFTWVFGSYALDISDLSNFDYDVSDSTIELEGKNVSSSITTGLHYDSRDKTFNPTEGAEHTVSLQYAGLGGTIGFTKVRVETGWYFPLFWEFTGFLHGKTGFVWRNSGGDLPDYNKFFLGGINSLRGFDWEDLAPTEINRYGYEAHLGGNKFVQFNVECIFPVLKNAGLVGLVFFDTGDVYGEGESIKMSHLRESVGFGVRWFSPMGPIRLENGFILNPKEGERGGGHWEFTMGSAF